MCKNNCNCSCKGEPGARGVQGAQGPMGPTGATGPSGNGYQVKIHITSAQLLTANSVPVLCVSAPMAGIAIRVLNASIGLTFNTTPYASNVNCLLITDTSNKEQVRATILDATVSTDRRVVDTSAQGVTDTQIISGKALYFKVETGNPTLGNSSIDVYITYELITL